MDGFTACQRVPPCRWSIIGIYLGRPPHYLRKRPNKQRQPRSTTGCHEPRPKPLSIPIRLIPELRSYITLPPPDPMSPILFVGFPANIIPSIPFLPTLPMSPFAALICAHDDLHLDPSR